MPTGRTATRQTCGAERDGLMCDREFGHLGDHRGYLQQHDAVLFWRNDLDQGVDCPQCGRRMSVREAREQRICNDCQGK